MSQEAYSNPLTAESGNLYSPRLSLEVVQVAPPQMTKFQLAKAILDLYRMGLIAEYVGEEEQGPPRFRLTEKSL